MVARDVAAVAQEGAARVHVRFSVRELRSARITQHANISSRELTTRDRLSATVDQHRHSPPITQLSSRVTTLHRNGQYNTRFDARAELGSFMTQSSSSTGQGSLPNVVAALLSLFIPGLGQLVQGRILAAIMWFLLGCALWILTLGWFGWVINILSCVGAARWKR